MRTVNYSERNMVESYSAVLNSLSLPCKIELMERLLQSMKNTGVNQDLPTGEFIPEKTAEQIVEELRESRSCGNTRIVEPF